MTDYSPAVVPTSERVVRMPSPQKYKFKPEMLVNAPNGLFP